MARRIQATVGIVGAGPSGLLLGNLLLARGIDCLVIDKFTREQIFARARAGLLEWRNKLLLERAGLGRRMLAEGRAVGSCEFRSPDGSFLFDYASAIGGCPHWVYPQQELVCDMTDCYLAAGGRVRFGMHATTLLNADEPTVVCEDANSGEEVLLVCTLLAGCDGFHGAVRGSLPADTLEAFEMDHPFQWLALLVAARPSSQHTIYARHPHGFAGHMLRSQAVTRYYLQCARSDVLEDWPDERVWPELRSRFAADDFALHEGPVIERTMLSMRSVVFEPMQHRNVILVGDAAHVITPCGAKGMNLALQDAATLAALLERHLTGDRDALAEYTPQRVPDIWRAQEFSHGLLHMLCNSDPGAGSSFLKKLQLARVENLQHVPDYARHIALAWVRPD